MDKITLLLDTATDDRTFDIVAGYGNTYIYQVDYEAGMDDKQKIDYVNECYRNSKADYVIAVDADEFVFGLDGGGVYVGLNGINLNKVNLDGVDGTFGFDIARVKLWEVYRHVSDGDLDPGKPVREQRRNGYYRWPYTKPCIARTGQWLTWGMGCHAVMLGGQRVANKRIQPVFTGAHWINADPCFCIKRRLGTMARQSLRNLERNLSKHNHNVTEESIRAELAEHERDPVVI